MEDIGAKYSRNVYYTIIKDLHDIIFFHTSDITKANLIATKMAANLMNDVDVKFRKPLVTVRTPKKSTTASIKSNVKGLENSSTYKINWQFHPENSDYGYTQEFTFDDGYYPLYDFGDDKVVGAVGETGTRELNSIDKKLLLHYGLNYSF